MEERISAVEARFEHKIDLGDTHSYHMNDKLIVTVGGEYKDGKYIPKKSSMVILEFGDSYAKLMVYDGVSVRDLCYFDSSFKVAINIPKASYLPLYGLGFYYSSVDQRLYFLYNDNGTLRSGYIPLV